MSRYFKCELNKPAIDFKCGETMQFRVFAREKCKNIGCKHIHWKIETDDGTFDSGVGNCSADKPLIIETVLKKPGFAHLTCTAYDNDNTPLENFDILDASAGADVLKIKYHDTLPCDFYDYWQNIERLIGNTSVEVLQCKEIPITNDLFKAYDMRIRTPEGRPSAFTLTVPNKNGKYPIKLNFMGYGVTTTPVSYNKDTITAHFNAHGIDTLLSEQEILKKYTDIADGYGFSDKDNSSNTDTYYRGMMIRALMGVKYLKTLEFWDKKTIVASGGSQGALQAVTVAAHDKDITFLDIFIPWFCDLAAREEGYITGWRPNFKQGLRYFDTVAQGMNVKCPVRINAGLGDYICPPSSVMSLYNNIKTLKTIKFVQAKTHSYDPYEIDECNLNYDPENPDFKVKKGRYRHFKGNEYEVLDFGYDCENLNKLVIYRALYSDRKVWVRPINEFEDFVYRDNKIMKRFEYIK